MTVHAIDEIISLRKTSKVLSKVPLSEGVSQADLDSMVKAAAQAPFHYAASIEHRGKLVDSSPEPWRLYVLHREACLDLRQWLLDRNDPSKIPDMLAAAGALIQTTWCPNPPPSDVPLPADSLFHANDINMEHVAATAAAIQNLLLHATSRGLPSYWSSGGPLRSQPVFDLLGIPEDEILLGAVFLFPVNKDQTEQVQVLPGKMRGKRSKHHSWCRDLTNLKI